MRTGIGFPAEAKPCINVSHMVLTFRDGQMHWLSLWERFLFRCGLTDANKLEPKLRPHLAWPLERRRE